MEEVAKSNGRGGARPGWRKVSTFHLDNETATAMHDLLKFKRRILHKPDFSVDEQVRLWIEREWDEIESSFGAKEAQEPYIL
jgi:hypothetical protein